MPGTLFRKIRLQIACGELSFAFKRRNAVAMDRTGANTRQLYD